MRTTSPATVVCLRADLTTRAPPGRLFFNCAMGQCRFFEWTDEFVADRADLHHRVDTWVSDTDRDCLHCLLHVIRDTCYMCLGMWWHMSYIQQLRYLTRATAC